MSKQLMSELDRYKINHTASGILLVGAILFLIGLGLSFLVTKDELAEKLTEFSNQNIGPAGVL